jgi:hypothetical protein
MGLKSTALTTPSIVPNSSPANFSSAQEENEKKQDYHILLLKLCGHAIHIRDPIFIF